MKVIEIKKLTKYFQKKTEFQTIALNNISLSIKKGELIALTGHNGSGKSTLMSIVTGVLKPDEGEINLMNKIILTSKMKLRKLKGISNIIGMSFQNPNLQIFKSTVIKDVAFSLMNNGMHKSEAEQKAKKLLTDLEFTEDSLERSPFQLSSGQKRKLILSSLLISDPEILVFDEPTANLDDESSIIFMNLLKKLNKEQKKTIVFISHNREIVERYAKREIVLTKGQISYDGKPPTRGVK